MGNGWIARTILVVVTKLHLCMPKTLIRLTKLADLVWVPACAHLGEQNPFVSSNGAVATR